MSTRLSSLSHEMAEVQKCLRILEAKSRKLSETELVLFGKLLERSRALAIELVEVEALEHSRSMSLAQEGK